MRAGQSSPGSTVHTARAGSPAASARERPDHPHRTTRPRVRPWRPRWGRAPVRVRRSGSRPPVPARWWGSRPGRGGAGPPAAARRRASRRTGRPPPGPAGRSRGAVPARARPPSPGRPAGRRARRRPARSSTYPSTSRPANRTRTRTPGCGGVGELRRYQIVERPVQVRQRHVDADPGHRHRGSRRPFRRLTSRVYQTGTSLPPRRPHAPPRRHPRCPRDGNRGTRFDKKGQ